MSLNVGSLWASLSLNITEFTASLSQATTAAQTAGAAMQQAVSGGAGGGAENASKAVNKLTKQVQFGAKDISRIVSGIMISQGFYKLISSVEQASSALFTFQNNMSEASMSLTYFLGSTDKANAFLHIMQDIAAVTPYNTEETTKMARSLMAMGIAPSQIKSMLGVLMDTGAATGATGDQMNRIVYAIGQINTLGKLSSRQLRELAMAGIPVYTILEKQLGLTKDQMENIGKAGISSSRAITALLNGLQEKYKGAAQKTSELVPGMISTIKDDLLIVGNTVFEGVYKDIQGVVKVVRDAMEKLRAARDRGIGGIFEALFPPELQSSIRGVVKGFELLGEAAGNFFTVIGSILEPAIGEFTVILGTVLPPIAAILYRITDLVRQVLNAVPAIRYFAATVIAILIARTAANAVVALAIAISKLKIIAVVLPAMLDFLDTMKSVAITAVKNPWMLVAMAVAAAAIYIISKTDAARAAIKSFQDQINAFFGVDTNDVFKPTKTSEEYKKQLQDIADLEGSFTDAAGDATDATDNQADAAKKAADANKLFAASFDELHQIPQDNGKDNGGGGGGTGAGGGAIPDTPDSTQTSEAPSKMDPSKWKWPTLPPLPPLPKLNVPDWLDETLKNLKDAWQKIGEWLRQPWPVPTPLPIPQIPPINIPNPLPLLQKWGQDLYDGFEEALGHAVQAIDLLPSLLFPKLNASQQDVIGYTQETGQSFDTWEQKLVPDISLVALALTGISLAAQGANTDMTTFTVNSPILVSAMVAAMIPALITGMDQFVLSVSTAMVNATVAVGTFAVNTIAAILQWGNNFLLYVSTAMVNALLSISNFSVQGLVDLGTFVTNTAVAIGQWVIDRVTDFNTFKTDAGLAVSTFGTQVALDLSTMVTNTATAISKWVGDRITDFGTFKDRVMDKIRELISNLEDKFKMPTVKEVIDGALKGFENLWGDSTTRHVTAVGVLVGAVAVAFSFMPDKVKPFFEAIPGLLEGIGPALEKAAQGLVSRVTPIINQISSAVSSAMSAISNSSPAQAMGKALSNFTSGMHNAGVPGFANGGIISREQLVRVGEGNRREGIIPLENENAMAPFADAVAARLNLYDQSGNGGSTPSQILYVGTLIADDYSLKQLERKMQVVRLQETQRKGGR